MAGLLAFSRADAVALPLTPESVETVVVRTRRANLAQMALSAGLVAGLLLAGRSASGWAGGLLFGLAGLGMWAILATVLSTWDHFRAASALLKRAAAEIARAPDPERFWRAHRGVFPYFTR